MLLIHEEGGSVFGHQVDQFSMINPKRNGQSGSLFGHQMDHFSIDKNSMIAILT
jgi:hypothetical protein